MTGVSLALVQPLATLASQTSSSVVTTIYEATNSPPAMQRWAGSYMAETRADARRQMLPEGLRLTVERRAAVADMIRTNPALATASSISLAVRKHLPPEITAQLETPVSGMGDYLVFAALPAKGGPAVEPIQRWVRLGDKTYRAYVHGRRLGETTKLGIPLHGVVMNGVLALDDKPLREFEAGELPDPNQPVSDLRSAQEQFTNAPIKWAQAGDKVFAFASSGQLQKAEALLESAEAGIGPAPAQSADDILRPSAVTGTNGPSGPTPSAVWTLGKKKVLVIRVDFADLAGEPEGYTAAQVQSFMDTQISPFYLASSYGLTSLTNTVTPVYRMPHVASYYATNAAINQLGFDAQTAANPAYGVNQYDRLIIYYSSMTYIPGSGINWGGISAIGGSVVHVNGVLIFAIVAHELGHTYGLEHANLWQVTDGNPVSDSGTSAEYLDEYDTMGGNYANDTRTDFNPWFKNMLGWFNTNQVRVVTTNGTYRINRFDTANATGALALEITKDGSRNYWVGYRRNFTNNVALTNGAYIVWGYNYNRQSDLLDTATPNFSDKDAALQVGSTLVDPAANLSITAVDTGSTTTNQYMDIKVTYGPIRPAIYTQPQSQVVVGGQNGSFVVQASGIPLPAYRWQREAAGSNTWVTLTNGLVYANPTNAALTVNAATIAMNGDQFRCILTNTSGSVTTAPALLTVIAIGVSTLAGHAGSFGSSDGTGSAASFKLPTGVAADGSGNVYVADRNNATVRKITPQGVVTTIAGLAGNTGTTDGTNNNARFNYLTSLTVDSAGSLYVADYGNSLIRKVTPVGTNWVVSTIAGQPGVTGNSNGVGTNASFGGPLSVAVDLLTNIYVADWFNQLVRKISYTGSNWTVTTLGPPQADPQGVGVDRFGNVYVANNNYHTVSKITPDGQSSLFAGNGNPGSQDGTGTNATFFQPSGLAADILGNIYVTDTSNDNIRMITPGGVVTTVAGQAFVGGSTDGALTNALFGNPIGITTDTTGNIYVADYANQVIRKIVTGPPIPLPRLDGAVKGKGMFRVALDGPVGSNYFVHVSSDMTTWQVFSTNLIPPGGWTTILDPIASNQAPRFYRASSQINGPGR